MSPLPTSDTDREALAAAIRVYLAAAPGTHPPTGGVISGRLYNKWAPAGSPHLDPGTLYVVERGKPPREAV